MNTALHAIHVYFQFMTIAVTGGLTGCLIAHLIDTGLP
jgi:hypothetical protein